MIRDHELFASPRLKNIRSLVTPELLFALAKAGEDDTIVFAANGFPSARLVTTSDSLIRMDGLSIPTILKEVMKLVSVMTSKLSDV
jgi:L-fucose mutarotase